MKINEKTLASFAVSSAPADREGWLLKRGEVNRSYQRRWCVLRGNLLFYSVQPGDKDPLGVIILEGCTVELAEEETEVYAFKIVFHGDGKVLGRTYTLGTQTQEDLEAWMKLVACASFDYMKLMVVELQQQLEEVERQEEEAQHPVAPPRAGQPQQGSRVNPFNSGGGGSAKGKGKSKSWTDLHKEWGARIKADREAWANRGSATIKMEDDTLLVVF